MNEAATHAPVPPRVVIASIAGIWLCYFVLASMRASVVGFELSPEMLFRRAGVTLGAMAVTLLLWPMLRLFQARPLWLKGAVVLLAALPASLAIAAVNQWAFADIESEMIAKIGKKEGISIHRDEAGNMLVDVPGDSAGGGDSSVTIERKSNGTLALPGKMDAENRFRQISDLALGRYFILLAWAALYLALANAAQAQQAERREGEYRRAAKAAELLSLRYQVNPHFLFNTLNSLSALVMTGKAEAAERMIQILSTFYRRSLAEDPSSDHALREEIELQKLYLEIEGVRFPDRLRTVIDIPAQLAEAQVPGMILQPLVENSVKYAVAASSKPVTITISAQERAGFLEVVVGDDGTGAAAVAGNGGRPVTGEGIGLANVRDRLAARFGNQASLETGLIQTGYRTVIRLPLGGIHG